LITANETHKASRRLKPKCNARTGSLLAYRAIQTRLGEGDLREMDIGERDIREKDVRKRYMRDRDMWERDIGETVTTC